MYQTMNIEYITPDNLHKVERIDMHCYIGGVNVDCIILCSIATDYPYTYKWDGEKFISSGSFYLILKSGDTMSIRFDYYAKRAMRNS